MGFGEDHRGEGPSHHIFQRLHGGYVVSCSGQPWLLGSGRASRLLCHRSQSSPLQALLFAQESLSVTYTQERERDEVHLLEGCVYKVYLDLFCKEDRSLTWHFKRNNTCRHLPHHINNQTGKSANDKSFRDKVISGNDLEIKIISSLFFLNCMLSTWR